MTAITFGRLRMTRLLTVPFSLGLLLVVLKECVMSTSNALCVGVGARILLEPVSTTLVTEVVAPALVCHLGNSVGHADSHATDWVGDQIRRGVYTFGVMSSMGFVVVHLNAHYRFEANPSRS